uniref:Interferon-related developmental regulator N-terminal domain-containing protein n=1 Tax=Giardia intestinalis TaxID=5741 RepID=A8W234_GIAIN|nr:hypothetical protein 3098 [Giardia intestinalis]ABW38709.1 hypothetical protein 3098 [Giardia intestinalis]ABW38715.1 hypothetical protein 3098 [Giardia intestinalis]ABW38721.1 hypothetical protein 3098 [Giardia intestinalis]
MTVKIMPAEKHKKSKGERKPVDDVEASNSCSEDSSAELFEVLDLLESKQPKARAAGLERFIRLLIADTTVDWLKDDAATACAAILKGQKYAQGEEYVRYLSILVRLVLTDTSGSVADTVCTSLPGNFVRTSILSCQPGTTADSIVAVTAFLLFGSFEESCVSEGIDTLALAALELPLSGNERALSNVYCCLAALVSLEPAMIRATWQLERYTKRLRALLDSCNVSVSDAVGQFILVLAEEDGFYRSFLPLFKELKDLHGKDISRDVSKDIRAMFSEYADELASRSFEHRTIKLRKYDALEINSRQLQARYAFILLALAGFDDVDHIISGNDTVRAFLGLPNAELKNVKQKGKYLDVVSDEELRKQRAIRQREKTERKQRK